MRLLYLYLEEWKGYTAHEFQTLATCIALADAGVNVTLVTASGEEALREQLLDFVGVAEVPGFNLLSVNSTLSPVQNTSIFSRNFNHWLKNHGRFDLAFTIHLKAGTILSNSGLPYVYEAQAILAQLPQNAYQQGVLHKQEGQVLASAAKIVATSAPLALALSTWFGLTQPVAVVPNAGLPPLGQSLSKSDGPFVYAGSIAEGSEVTDLILAAGETKIPLKIIGGTETEWRILSQQIDTAHIAWQPRLPLSHLSEALTGARAGLIPTNPDGSSGEFSSPLKLFDYARCGLPVISTPLASLGSLDVGLWCTQIPSAARIAWVEALSTFAYTSEQAEAARYWSGGHTWSHRAEQLLQVFREGF